MYSLGPVDEAICACHQARSDTAGKLDPQSETLEITEAGASDDDDREEHRKLAVRGPGTRVSRGTQAGRAPGTFTQVARSSLLPATSEPPGREDYEDGENSEVPLWLARGVSHSSLSVTARWHTCRGQKGAPFSTTRFLHLPSRGQGHY